MDFRNNRIAARCGATVLLFGALPEIVDVVVRHLPHRRTLKMNMGEGGRNN